MRMFFVTRISVGLIVVGMQILNGMDAVSCDERELARCEYATLSKKIYSDLDAKIFTASFYSRRAWLDEQLAKNDNPFLSYMMARTILKHPGYPEYDAEKGFYHFLLCVSLTHIAEMFLQSEGLKSEASLAGYIKRKFIHQYGSTSMSKSAQLSVDFTRLRDQIISKFMTLQARDELITSLPLPYWILGITHGTAMTWGIGWVNMEPGQLDKMCDEEFMGRWLSFVKRALNYEKSFFESINSLDEYFEKVFIASIPAEVESDLRVPGRAVSPDKLNDRGALLSALPASPKSRQSRRAEPLSGEKGSDDDEDKDSLKRSFLLLSNEAASALVGFSAPLSKYVSDKENDCAEAEELDDDRSSGQSILPQVACGTGPMTLDRDDFLAGRLPQQQVMPGVQKNKE